MTKTKIPQLYKTETVDLNGNELEIKGFRGNDYAIVRTLNKIANETMAIQLKFAKITKDKEDVKMADLPEKDVQEIIKIRNEIEDKTEITQPLIEKLGQRGIKRAENPTIKSTEKIDEIPDRELDYPILRYIYEIMAQLSTPPKTIGDDGKKPNTEV
jgi:hypothetical protein